VFSKLNVKLDDKLVEAVIEAKPGAIEQILTDLKRKVMELSPKTMSVSNLGANMSGRSLFRRTDSQQPSGEKRTPAPFASAVTVSATQSSTPVLKQSRIPPKDVPSKVNSNRPPLSHRKKSHARALQQAKKAADPKSKAEVEPEAQAESGSQNERQSADLPEADKTIDGYTGPSPSAPEMDENANEDLPAYPPARLICKGHVMIPELMLNVKNKQVQDMESIISSLTKKVNFLDTLIIQKDERLEQMAQELLQLKSQVAVQPEPTPTLDM